MDKIDELLLSVQKPGRYAGGEVNSIIKDKSAIDVRFAFCFPDTYEIGMSHLGMKILYAQLNTRSDIWCERVFAPWIDFEAVLRREHIPLFALESRDAIKDFDFIGFTLQYELCYTNVLNMLDLAGLPLRAADRTALSPLVVAGGPCTCNPEPLCDFVDLFFQGEGEQVDLEVIDLYKEYRKKGATKQEFLRAAAQIKGVYVPSLYTASYHADGTVAAVTPTVPEAPAVVEKRIEPLLDETFYPDRFVVPYIDIVHDRAVQEIFRGCIRGCRFCQAGFIYRPVREKSPETVLRQAKALCNNTGYDELSLSSLSTSDYTGLRPLLEELAPWAEHEKISLSLPSLRIDNFSDELLKKVSGVRKTGLTFAPEAGTQRLRDVINKNLTEEEILSTCRTAFAGGYTQVKLYFMLGLPTETDADIIGIAQLGQKIVNLYYAGENRPKGRTVNVTISVANFVPKPHTPFEFEPQITREEMLRRQKLLRDSLTTRKITLNWHDSQTSVLEGVFARGDRRLGAVLAAAQRLGCKFDGWDECFAPELWAQAFAQCGLTADFYACRTRSTDEVFPWDHLWYGADRDFLVHQNQLAHDEIPTPHCRAACAGCGANRYGRGVCFEKR